MVIRKRKKVNKYRGHTTHGGGSRKKRRGAGSRGGRGRAGTGKRAGQKKAGISRKLGKKGFSSKSGKKGAAINLGDFTKEKLENLSKKGKVTKENDVFVVDLEKLGYQKLLSGGKVACKIKFIVEKTSSKVEEKVKAAGGEVVSSGVLGEETKGKEAPKEKEEEKKKSEEEGKAEAANEQG